MSKKVVYIACGGARCYWEPILSRKAAERLFELGKKELEKPLEYNEDGGFHMNGHRHDPRLVQMVEELGKEATILNAELKIATIEGDRYIIDQKNTYSEVVREVKDMEWIVIE
jgi:hypothetical protein